MRAALSCRRCWLYWVLLGCWLEQGGYRRDCHPTFSRDTKALLVRLFGRRGPWAATAAGLWFTWHLFRLPDDPPLRRAGTTPEALPNPLRRTTKC